MVDHGGILADDCGQFKKPYLGEAGLKLFRTILVIAVSMAVFYASAFAEEKNHSETKSYIGEIQTHIADHEDTFIDLARAAGLGFVEMRAANPGIDPWLPGEGRKIVIPSRHLLPQAPEEGIVINLPEMRLYFFSDDGSEPETYAIGIGREGFSTPLGRTKIIDKKEAPEWRPTKRMREEDPELPVVVPPGPENPLGTHALYLGWPQYRIHGTNKPYGIGRRVSSGCIRLYPEGIVELYEKVDEGIPVEVVNQPVKTGWIGDSFYIEAHPTIEQADQVEMDGYSATYRLEEDDLQQILHAAGDYVSELDWPVIRKTIRERRGYPVEVARKPEMVGHNKQSPASESDPAGEGTLIN